MASALNVFKETGIKRNKSVYPVEVDGVERCIYYIAVELNSLDWQIFCFAEAYTEGFV